MRKLLVRVAIVLGVLSVVPLLILLKLAWQYRATLPVEGVVTDAVTGQPIEKMIVMGVWHYQRPNLVDSTGQFSVYHAVTGEDGKYSIPKKRVNGVLESFVFFELRLEHPLYETKSVKITSYTSPEYLVGEVRENKLNLNIPVLSLEDRYSRPEDIYDLATVLASERAAWYLFLKQRYGLRYDIKEVLARRKILVDGFEGEQEDPDYLTLQREYRGMLQELKKLEGKY